MRNRRLQQCLPLAVLKQENYKKGTTQGTKNVATVLTACGIETVLDFDDEGFAPGVATVLTACGIETATDVVKFYCGIGCCNSAYRLRY